MNNENILTVFQLPFDATDEGLVRHFATCGKVISARIVHDVATGRSRGFAVIEFSTAAEATLAFAKLNGSLFQGRNLVIEKGETET